MNRFLLKLFIALTACSTLTHCGLTKTSTPPVPGSSTSPFPLTEWYPELDQPIEDLSEFDSTHMTQGDMNYRAANIAFANDTKLYVLFHHYLASLPVSERANQIEEQRKWLAERERKSKAAGEPCRGGSMEPLLIAGENTELTEKRIKEIEKRMKR